MPQEYLPAPYEGMDVSVPAHRLPPTKAPYIRNFLVDGDRMKLRGRLMGRAPMGQTPVPVTTAGVTMTEPGWAFPVFTGTKVLLRTLAKDGQTGANNLVERWWPWDAFDPPHPGLISTEPPTFGRLQFYDAYLATLANHGVGTGANTLPQAFGPHVAAYNDNFYAITTGADASLYIKYPANSARFHPLTILSKLPKLSSELATGPTGTGNFTEAPRMAQGIAAFAERLFVLGGMPASLTATADTVVSQEITAPFTGPSPRVLKPNTLWYTNIAADPMIDLSWRTNSVLNSLVVGVESPEDYGMGLTTASRFMVIHKRRSTWVLTGSGLDSFQIRQISSTVGLVDPRARVAHKDVVYWISAEGLYSYDGAEVRLLSEAISPLLKVGIMKRSAVWDPALAPRESGSFINLCVLPNDYLLLNMGRNKLHTPGAATADVVDQSWLYHIPTGRWTVFYTQAYGNGYGGPPSGAARAGHQYVHITTNSAFDVSATLEPLATDNQRNNDAIYVSGGSNTVNRNFPAECHFAPVRLAAPWSRASVDRYGVETIEEYSTLASLDGNLKSQLVRYARQAIQGQEPTPATDLTALISTTNPYDYPGAVVVPDYLPSISAHEVTLEATDVQVRIVRDYTADVGTTSGRWMEIIGAYLEWRTTHERAS